MRKALLLISILMYWLAPLSAQQPSLLDQIMQTQNALVEVQAENNVGLAKAGRPQAARDPATGRIVILQGITHAEYQRKGAGVIIHPSGVIVTNAHVVSKANRIAIILADRSTLSAQVLRIVNDLDIALLKIEAPLDLPYVTLADSNAIQLGEEIITSGSSPLMNQTVTGGKVIGLGVNRTLQRSGQQRNDLIQTTVNLYEGDSGGPLFNRKGELIGLMTAKETTADHSSFAIPSNKIAFIMQDYFNQLTQEQEKKHAQDESAATP